MIKLGFTPGGNYVKKVEEFCAKTRLRKDQVKVVHYAGCHFYKMMACNCDPQVVPLVKPKPRIKPKLKIK